MSQNALTRMPIAVRRTRFLGRPGWLTASVVYGLLIVLCALAAYWAMFSQLAPYDDEGFFDYSLKLFVAQRSDLARRLRPRRRRAGQG
jgi:hypothetical protein